MIINRYNTTMNKIIEVATAEIGYKEDPPNSNKTKYGKWFGMDSVAWCGIFVSWVYHHAGYPLGNIGFTKGFAGCQTAVKHFQDSGEVVDTPQQGDLAFFDWNKDGRYDHVGIVESNNEITFRTIEGNTSLNNNSNGGEVMLRTRYHDHNTAIFVRPRVVRGELPRPDFLFKDSDGRIIGGFIGGVDVTERWNAWLKKVGLG